jgi:hypothetical protein
MAETVFKYDVFISYSYKDEAYTHKLTEDHQYKRFDV